MEGNAENEEVERDKLIKSDRKWGTQQDGLATLATTIRNSFTWRVIKDLYPAHTDRRKNESMKF